MKSNQSKLNKMKSIAPLWIQLPEHVFMLQGSGQGGDDDGNGNGDDGGDGGGNNDDDLYSRPRSGM